MTIVVTMFKLLFTMAVGYYLGKRDILTSDVNRKLSTMIVDITAPLLMISSVSTAPEGNKSDVLFLLFSGLALYCCFPIFGWLAAKLVKAPKGTVGVYICMLMFANTAFMGYPVTQAFYGDSAIFYTTIFNFGFSVLFYLLGAYLIDKEGGVASRFEFKRILSPGLIIGILSVVIYFSDIKLPQLITQPSSFIGNITTPLSMLIIGANMISYNVKDIFTEKRLYVMSFIRLLVMPLITAFYLNLLTDNKLLVCMASMTIGMPVASMLAMAGGKYESTARVSNISVVMSTLCSIVTIPILAIIFRLWFGF